MLNGVFKGGVEGKAYDYLVVGVGLGGSDWKGFGLQLMGVFLRVYSKRKQVS